MREIDLRQEQPSIADLLQFAATGAVLIRNENGQEFILEVADAFDREVAELSRNERFMSFLAERGSEPGKTSLEETDRRLGRVGTSMEDQP
jgi:hypothetical protein